MPVYEYLKSISGLSQKITPQEGRASISGVTFELVDVDGYVSSMIAGDDTNLHRKKVQIDAGYLGLDGDDFTTVFTGYITGIKTGRGGKTFVFNVTDSTKWGQNKIFRSATSSSPIVRAGNPLTLMLELLTGTGLGTNGDYDFATHGADEGLGMDEDLINVAEIESVRDTYFSGNTYYMSFSITGSEVGRDFISREILKPLNLYPYTDGQGRFSVRVIKPPTVSTAEVQSITDEHIIGVPTIDLNFEELVTLIEFSYDWDGSEFDSKAYYYDSDAVASRGVGKKAIAINSKGWKTGSVDMNLIMESRKSSIFARYNPPPLKISLKTTFDRWLTEIGDLVPVTCALVPNVETGTMGITAREMEVISKSVDWTRGAVNFVLLDTGFSRDSYSSISPIMTVTSGTSATEFEVSTADAALYSGFTNPEIQLLDSMGRQKVAAVTITDISGTTVTCDSLGSTPVAGDIVQFANYGSCTTEQKNYGFLSPTAEDEYLIVP